MSAPARTVAGITAELFSRLNSNRLRYAALRNYERLALSPDAPSDQPITDIDLVMHQQDVPAWRKLAAGLAEDCGWDVLTECSHFCESRMAEHRIEIFRFYRLSPPACLQVDIFHGYLLLGLPFENEQTMLAGRFDDAQFNITRISPQTENAYSLLQIHSLLSERAPEEKIARYRAKIMEHYAANHAQFRSNLEDVFSSFGTRALDALAESDWPRFRRAMRLGKARYLARFGLEHPLASTRYWYERARDNWLRLAARPCGFVLDVYAPAERDRSMVRQALADLKKKKILPAWTDGGSERRVMERGGIVVKWADSPGSALDVIHANHDEVAGSILQRLIDRHRALYRAPDLHCR